MNNEEYLTKIYDGIIATKQIGNETLYLVKDSDDDCYLIIGGGLYEYAELRMPFFDENKAKMVFSIV